MGEEQRPAKRGQSTAVAAVRAGLGMVVLLALAVAATTLSGCADKQQAQPATETKSTARSPQPTKAAPESSTVIPEPGVQLEAPLVPYDRDIAKRATPFEYRISGALFSLHIPNDTDPYCTGVALSGTHLLSASHCIRESDDETLLSSLELRDSRARRLDGTIDIKLGCSGCIREDRARDLAVLPLPVSTGRDGVSLGRTQEKLPDMVLWGFGAKAGKPRPLVLCGAQTKQAAPVHGGFADHSDSGGPLVALALSDGKRRPVVLAVAIRKHGSNRVRFTLLDQQIINNLSSSRPPVTTYKKFAKLCSDP